MDRAKANYVRQLTSLAPHIFLTSQCSQLCGQLRLRLQYAKLKVEYGWVSRHFTAYMRPNPQVFGC